MPAMGVSLFRLSIATHFYGARVKVFKALSPMCEHVALRALGVGGFCASMLVIAT